MARPRWLSASVSTSGRPRRTRREARRPGDVAAAAEHGVRAALAQDAARGRDRGRRAARPPRTALTGLLRLEAADPQEVDLVAGLGDQLGLGALARADEADLGATAIAQRVCDGDRRHDVTRRAAGRYHDSCLFQLCLLASLGSAVEQPQSLSAPGRGRRRFEAAGASAAARPPGAAPRSGSGPPPRG